MRIFILGIVLLLAGIGAAVALADKPPAPPGKDPCSHGNTGKPCKPDPQPDKGKDCEKHGKEGGVNEDHCKGETNPPTTTTDTTTTTTQPPTTTTVTTQPPSPRCPPGMTPTAGKDGQPGNDECEFPKQPPAVTTTPAVPTTPVVTTPAPTTPTPTTSVPTTPEVTPAETKAVTPKELEKEAKEQAKKNGAPEAGPAPEAVPGELPKTGLPLGVVALLGATLVGIGGVLRRHNQ